MKEFLLESLRIKIGSSVTLRSIFGPQALVGTLSQSLSIVLRFNLMCNLY